GDGEVLGAVVVFRDLTQVRTLEREMAYMTSHDALTGLLSRQDFEIYLEAALEAARDRGLQGNGGGGPHALLHLDLVELKLVNDCYGHVAGDELLRQVAEQLKRTMGAEGVVGRVGGGDFAVLVENRALPEAEGLARRIQRTVADFRFQWGGQRFEVGFHIGVASIDAGCPNVTFALRAADNAAYKARQRGRHKIHVYDPLRDSLGDHHGRLHWLQRLRVALAEDRFVLYHQRIEPMRSGRVLHEILVRMVGDSGEHIAPGRFIPIAEEHDMAPLLDRWVMRRSFELLGDGALGEDPVSLNLSAQSLGDESFLDDLLGLLRTSGVDAHRIYFEITETHAVASLGRALRFIGALEEVGCRFILDDFGSGFSSFGYLKNLPVDVLKIDGQFVREIDTDPVARAMVASITEIAHLMNLTTIAEHVENDAHLDAAREIGVDYAQGFRLHRPEEIPGQ
ncbi:MAG: EAL domain-containing protein, partial [Acidobacteriota bacterium]